jgi:hypothetical protein
MKGIRPTEPVLNLNQKVEMIMRESINILKGM